MIRKISRLDRILIERPHLYVKLQPLDPTSAAQVSGKANMTYADLTGTSLFGANLTDADWFETICPDGTKNEGITPCVAAQHNLT